MATQQPLNRQHLASEKLRQSLRAYLRRRLPDEAPVDDLLQDIFVKALAAESAGRQIKNLVGWLYAAARTTAVDYYRSRGEPMQALDSNLPEAEAEDISLHSQLAECVMTFVEQLPPKYQQTLLATDIQGEAMRRLAEREQVSVSAIKSRASRARSMLKATLLACCHVETVGGLVSDYHTHSKRCCGADKPGA